MSLILYAAAISAPQQANARPENAADKMHHLKDGRGYVNPWKSFKDMTTFTIGKELLWRRVSGKANQPVTKPCPVPVRKPVLLDSRDTPKLRATWLGHACYYVEFRGGLRVLFDPVFEHRCSPNQWVGPARYSKVPCQIEDLPYIDAVVISHAHYDHLSLPSVLRVQKKFPNAQFFAPLGNKAWFQSCGIPNITEMDWWDQQELKLSKIQNVVVKNEQVADTNAAPTHASPDQISAVISCVPCQHMAARTPFDKAQTLWASWIVESGGQKVYFAGDTGYRGVPELPATEDDYSEKLADLPVCPAFEQIGKLYGPFDLGLIPIGAYTPRWIMSNVHANPFDSVNIFLDTKCRRALAMHWGTWLLTEEDVMEPPQLLKTALYKKGMPEEGVFDICDIGESREY